jgi:homoserine dehydrogenase
MTAAGKPYSQALAEAQAAGYAEADPTYDVEGIDAAHKIAILASMAFGEDIPFDRISIEGISKLELVDIVNAGQLGYVVKLLAIAERMTDHRLSLRVHPTLVGRGTPLAMVDGPFNAISIFGHAVGHVLMYGRGAGQSPTASAVVSDLVDIAIGHAHRRFQSLHIWPGKTRPAQIVSTDRLSSRFYLRLSVADQPGVFAQITKVFGGHNISLASVLQKESPSPIPGKAEVNVLMMTHRAVEGDLRAALTQINRLDVVKSPTIWLRVVDMPWTGRRTCRSTNSAARPCCRRRRCRTSPSWPWRARWAPAET